MKQSFSASLLKWRFLTSVLVLALCGWLVTGTDEPSFDTDYRVFFDDDDPQLLAHESIEREFTKSQTLLFLVESLDGDLFSAKRLASLQELTNDAWRLPYVLRVNSLSNYQHTSAEGDDLWVEDLIDQPLDYSEADTARIRDIVMAESELRGILISDDGRVTMVAAYVDLDAAEESVSAKTELMLKARALAAEFESRHPDLKLRINGQVAVDYALEETATDDAAKVEFRMLLALLLLMAVLLRSIAATLGSVAVMLATVAAAAGLTTLLYDSFNAINVSSLYVVVMLSMLDCVHVLSAYFSRLASGDNKFDAMRASIDKNLEALFLTTLTTSIGFGAMNFSASPPFREFGTVTAISVWIALLLSLTLLPAIVLLFPGKAQRRAPVTAMVEWLQAIFPRASRWYMPTGFLFVAVLLPLAFTNVADDDLMEAFYEDAPIRQSAAFAEKHLAGYAFIEYSLRGEGANSVTEPAYLKQTEAFVTWLEAQPEVLHVASFSRIVKRLSKSMHGDQEEWYRIPDDPRATAEYVLVYESSVPPGLDLQDSVNLDKSALRVTAYLKSISSVEGIDFSARAMSFLEQQTAIVSAEAASPFLMFAYIGQENIRSMLIGCIIVSLFVCLTMIITFRSVILGVLCMIPNLMPAVLAFGLCGLFIGEINMGGALVFTIALGIVVDDTIHFVVSYRRVRRETSLSPEQAIEQTYSLVGRAIIITSIMLCVGFLIPVIFANLKMNELFYGLAFICVAGALLADLFFLPAMLVWIDKRFPGVVAPRA
ncbi:MAG: putative RND superfamily exporter protein [Bacteroidia bacterium]|jgi:predicted RND superfamily exporter protein